MKQLSFALILMTFLAVSGCAGYRSGVASAPYVGEVEPVPTSTETSCSFRAPTEVQLPGVKLDIRLNNRIRTSEHEVILFFVPLSFDPRDKPYFKETDRLTVGLTIIPANADFVFDPPGVTVTVDGKAFSPTTTRLKNFDKIRAYLRSSPRDPYDETLLSDLVDKKIALIKDKYYVLTMTFDCPVPTPERAITLDIGWALLHPKLPKIPMIRFMKIRWKECYT